MFDNKYAVFGNKFMPKDVVQNQFDIQTSDEENRIQNMPSKSETSSGVVDELKNRKIQNNNSNFTSK